MIQEKTAEGRREVKLPSGRVASIITRVTGRHQHAGNRMAGMDPHKGTYGLIAATTTIDGRALTIEDVMDLDLADILLLGMEVQGKDLSSLLDTSFS